MSFVQKKVMLLGDIGVGKSSIARRMVFNTFESTYKTTIGVDIHSCDIDLADTEQADGLRLSIWDTDGDFGVGIFQTVYIRGASGALVVADVTRPRSLEKLQGLVQAFQEHLPGRPVVSVLNKTDLMTAMDVANIQDRLDQRGEGVFATSALRGEGIREAFSGLARFIVQRAL
ncbi:MAG: Rab family GTPase [Alphaproteobacteria bacterium]